MNESKYALKVDDLDNVATIFTNGITQGSEVEVIDKRGNSDRIIVNSNIPYGHKIAIKDILPGENIIKYGETIGRANCKIQRGDYVHVHNLEAMRGRGDL